MKKSTWAIFLALFLVSCVQETITPAFDAPKDPERSFYVSVPISEITVIDEFGQDIGDIPIVGGVFQELARMFANISIDNENGSKIYLEPQHFRFMELNRVDFAIVTKLNLDKVMLLAKKKDPELVDLDIDNKVKEPSLKFIKRLAVYVSHDLEMFEKMKKKYKNKEMPLPLENSTLVLSYDKTLQPSALACETKCVHLTVSDVDWKKMLKTERDFIVQTVLVVDQVPDSNMKLGGTVNFSLGVDIGF